LIIEFSHPNEHADSISIFSTTGGSASAGGAPYYLNFSARAIDSYSNLNFSA
jgi:hypothetical protein